MSWEGLKANGNKGKDRITDKALIKKSIGNNKCKLHPKVHVESKSIIRLIFAFTLSWPLLRHIAVLLVLLEATDRDENNILVS